jgi:hypothetical protein
VERDFILAEVRRTAEGNGGRPLGSARFQAETGIRSYDWGRFWARWGDALTEAGFLPNQLQGRIPDDVLFERLAEEFWRLGRLPTMRELQLRHRKESAFPDRGVFERLGPKASWPRLLVAHFGQRADMAELVAAMEPLVAKTSKPSTEPEAAVAPQQGYVYLLKSGRYYKVGRTWDVGRRKYDLAIQLPDPVTEEHVIATDDPCGIEKYWHERFSENRKNGEWFELSRADVAAFKRRKFM